MQIEGLPAEEVGSLGADSYYLAGKSATTCTPYLLGIANISIMERKDSWSRSRDESWDTCLTQRRH